MPVAKLGSFDQKTVGLAAFARALSHPARISILRHLAACGEAPSMELVAKLPLSQPACSRHINTLLKAGLLQSRTSGPSIFFRLEKTALHRFCQTMNQTLHPTA